MRAVGQRGGEGNTVEARLGSRDAWHGGVSRARFPCRLSGSCERGKREIVGVGRSEQGVSVGRNKRSALRRLAAASSTLILRSRALARRLEGCAARARGRS